MQPPHVGRAERIVAEAEQRNAGFIDTENDFRVMMRKLFMPGPEADVFEAAFLDGDLKACVDHLASAMPERAMDAVISMTASFMALQAYYGRHKTLKRGLRVLLLIRLCSAASNLCLPRGCCVCRCEAYKGASPA